MIVIFKCVIPKRMLWIKFMSSSCEIALSWMLQNGFADQSTKVGSVNGLVQSYTTWAADSMLAQIYMAI